MWFEVAKVAEVAEVAEVAKVALRRASGVNVAVETAVPKRNAHKIDCFMMVLLLVVPMKIEQ